MPGSAGRRILIDHSHAPRASRRSRHHARARVRRLLERRSAERDARCVGARLGGRGPGFGVGRPFDGGQPDVRDALVSLGDASVTGRRAGLAPIKINTVVQRGVNDHTLLDLLAHFRGTGVIVRFIEYMDVGTRNHWNPELVVPSRELAARIHARWPIAPREANYRGEVAERHAYADGAGEIGFISSVSQPFCGDCSRGRLSSDGSFYTCLFATQGTDLRAPLRAGASDDELHDLIRNVWAGRSDRYSETRATQRDAAGLHKVEMNYIGG